MVSTPLKNISQNGNLPQIGVKIKIFETTTQGNIDENKLRKSKSSRDVIFLCENPAQSCREPVGITFQIHWKAQLHSHHFFPSIRIFIGFDIGPLALQVANPCPKIIGSEIVSCCLYSPAQKKIYSRYIPDTKNKKTIAIPNQTTIHVIPIIYIYILYIYIWSLEIPRFPLPN